MPAPLAPYRQRLIDQIGDVPDEYLPALLRVVSAFRESVAFLPADESVRLGWAEAQAGEVHPASELWDGFADE